MKTLTGILIFLSIPCQADLATVMKQQQDQPVVITEAPGTTDGSYELFSTPLAEFAQNLGLDDPSTLENSYFKIVESTGDNALPTSDFDGNNVLYHLMRARSYYASLAQNSGFPDEALDSASPRKLLVRIRVQNAYNPVSHFATQADYDNSRYIPAEAPLFQTINAQENSKTAPWNQEIWFDRQKTVTGKVDWYNLVTSAGLAAITQDWVSLSATPLQLLNGYNAGIDGAKIPDVIYHEAFHYASDAEGLFVMASEGNPVAEDYANYFGSSINGRPAIAEIDEFSSASYKRDYSKVKEIKNSLPESYNSNPFGPAVFWQIRNQLGQKKTDQLIWNSLHYLNGSALHTDVPKAVSSAAHNDSDLNADEVSFIDTLFSRYSQSYINLELKFNPGAKTIQDEETLKKAASDQADQLKTIPNTLSANGVTLDSDTVIHISTVADGLKAESQKAGFRSKVVLVLNKIAQAVKLSGEDVGKAIGYTGTTVFSLGESPMNFGTDLFSSLILGHGMNTDGDTTIAAKLTGAAGGVTTTYYSYAGLAALGFSLSSMVTSSAFGVVFIDSEVCSKATPGGVTSLDQYCAENSKIMQTLNSDSEKLGSEIGSEVHHELKNIAQFFKKIFS